MSAVGLGGIRADTLPTANAGKSRLLREHLVHELAVVRSVDGDQYDVIVGRFEDALRLVVTGVPILFGETGGGQLATGRTIAARQRRCALRQAGTFDVSDN